MADPTAAPDPVMLALIGLAVVTVVVGMVVIVIGALTGRGRKLAIPALALVVVGHLLPAVAIIVSSTRGALGRDAQEPSSGGK